MQITHEMYMNRCIDLALLGAGMVMPNPMVGAVLVHNGRIIGEGYHQQYGGPHAEVNCLNSVSKQDQPLVTASTLYVSLEPCAHFGKTPPCADLIIQKRIRKVVIGRRDPFTEVNGKGIEKLQNAGVEVITGVLENECRVLNKRFFTFHTKHRPYIILKWAETADGKIGSGTADRWLISNEYTNRLVHQWRSEEAAILIGTNTALLDDPSLTNRFYPGSQPVRMVLDRQLRLPKHLQLFNRQEKTIIFNEQKQEEDHNVFYEKLDPEENMLQQVMQVSYEKGLQSILVEGGAQLLRSFINMGLWDEIRVIRNSQVKNINGVESPEFTNQVLTKKETIHSDIIYYYSNNTLQS